MFHLELFNLEYILYAVKAFTQLSYLWLILAFSSGFARAHRSQATGGKSSLFLEDTRTLVCYRVKIFI